MQIDKQLLISHSSFTTYSRGEAYYRKNAVSHLLRNSNTFIALVDGSSFDEYTVHIPFDDAGPKLDRCRCTCPAYSEYAGLCKHIIATLLKLDSLGAFAHSLIKPATRSDNSASMMLRTYAQRIATEASAVWQGTLRLEPILETSSHMGPSLFFRIGEKRMYVVPDLAMFALHLKNGDTKSYGKNLTVSHSIASFDAESRPLVSFFLQQYDAASVSASYAYRYANAKRNMDLPPAKLDALLALLGGKSIKVRGNQSNSDTTAIIVSEDYRPTLILVETDDGALLSLEDACTILHGYNGLYIISENRLHCCSKEFTAACEALLVALSKENGNTLFFAKSDIPALFSAVLPRIEPYVTLQGADAFEQYKPIPLATKIYFDAPDEDSITARMVFAYGDTSFPAFEAKKPSQSIDIASEIIAETTLAGYLPEPLPDGTRGIQDDPDAVYQLIANGLPALSAIAEIYTTSKFGRVKLHPPATVSLGVRVESGLLSLDIDLEGLDLSELPGILASYRSAKKYYRLRDGSFLTLEESALLGLSELAEGLDLTDAELAAGHADTPASRALYLDTICKQNDEMRISRSRDFKHLLRDMRDVENTEFEVPKQLSATLRNYQHTGYRWLRTIAAYGFGGILADDMGLGKTLQVLTLLSAYKAEESETLPSIVVCPSSLALNWESEATKFTPHLRVLVIDGVAAERAQRIEHASEYDLLVTSYDALKRDIRKYEKVTFQYVIIDEAQYIKNQTTQNAKSVKALKSHVRFALTGTPIENSLAELWSIFDFLMPGYLLTYSRFKKKYETPIVRESAEAASQRLRQLVSPFLLRRMKKDVLRELPPKTETTQRSIMEMDQRKVYAANLLQAQNELATLSGSGQDKLQILAMLTRLRQICCDPSLVYDNYDGESAKLQACLELIDRCIQAGRRILLFSQFTSMLDILEEALATQKIRSMRIDGSTKPSRRLELVNTFNEGDTPIFLISLKAGGTGLNLTGADVVIHYDPWWNLSAQNQATDRAYRIGQKRSVQVYKLIVKDTIEERILQMQERKADLANAILDDSASPFEKLTHDELLSLFSEARE